MTPFEPTERKRYSRQIILPEIGLRGQEKLKNARVLVIGAGGLGCPLLQYLTAAGIGTIGIVDDDTVDISNLHRQILYGPDDVGKSKALIAQEKLLALNPYVNIETFQKRLSENNATELIERFDIIVDGSDNFPTRYAVNDACVALDKPLVFGSILRFEGQVSVFNYRGGPTYRCLFPDAEEGDSCAEAGVIGILPGIIGSYMANEVIKMVCEIGQPLSGKLLIFNALSNETHTFSFSRNPDTEIRKTAISAPTSEQHTAQPGEITFEEFEISLQNNPDSFHLVDVREEYEFEEDFIGGINIPLPDLPQSLSQMPADKTIVFYCRTGKRSQIAATLLRQAGFEGRGLWMKAYN
ncbi:putative adenylyltransferase/sulfurtransferase MoeZ [Dyadobacter sp. CECT 9275]|uniref:Molybdopterin-synthase adenylyltransferase n=1 Tax=Dyadobacter helix TaxID=2822344 RepID=A0A916JAD7_9BACT|nr:HesA/MoeB/ThiF family protein [Dyadobacter sp. CECT 9275]CAG4994270.1 putative adenylyltransferase/sulfurtransferase MoeZ [Dyadobacter sp. CECT 9275]